MGVHLPDGSNVDIPRALAWGGAGVWIAIVLAFYALRSIAVFVMAKKRNVNNAWIAFLPCVWFYTACKIVGDTKFFGKTFNQLAWVFTAVFTISKVLVFAYNFIVYLPVVGNFV